jgi:RNA polymerase sigma-70 factor (ECF subfamily)
MAALAVASEPPSRPPTGAPDRLRAMMDGHFDFVWRSLRRLGLLEHEADDGTQRVFLVVSRRLESIQPGSERAFLFRTAVRVASSVRRTIARRREVLCEQPPETAEVAPRSDELLEQRQARELLDEVLASLDMDLRAVFVLFELEELSLPEIAQMLGIPRGTASSRLRRAREAFSSELARRQARIQRGGR